MSNEHRFQLFCEVIDEQTLFNAARDRAIADGLGETYPDDALKCDGEIDVSACLVMLLDPGVLPGCDINHSESEKIFESEPDPEEPGCDDDKYIAE